MAAKKVKEAVAYFDHPEQVEEPGFYTLTGDTETDENGVEHESNFTPDSLVYASPDGEGFVYDKPEQTTEQATEGGES